jgi:hypothetical protein
MLTFVGHSIRLEFRRKKLDLIAVWISGLTLALLALTAALPHATMMRKQFTNTIA